MKNKEKNTRSPSLLLEKHYKPHGFKDWLALKITKILKFPLDQLFRKRYAHRAMIIETVAAVPGMLAGSLLHYKSLTRFIDDKGWIEALVEESHNERMHLETFLAVVRPAWYERALIYSMQWFMFVFYGFVYRLSPIMAHRFVGYTEEAAIDSYTQYLKALKTGETDNFPAPPLAIEYWNLSKDATFIEVIEAIRQDECRHRDTNHHFADLLVKKEGPASLKPELRHRKL